VQRTVNRAGSVSNDVERLRFRRAVADLQVGLQVKAISSTKAHFSTAAAPLRT
jgi:hypothetical protein